MTTVASYFETLGKRIQAQVQSCPDWNETFTSIATDAVTEIPAPHIDAAVMTDWICDEPRLPRQVNKLYGFGQPPLVVYETPNFYIEVLFWFPSRTSIHAHSFSGAFRVLSGASLQVEYAFHEEELLEEGLRIGKLEVREVDLITTGKICPIKLEEDFIHTVVHLGNPSLTLVVRTYGRKETPQFAFLGCGLAYDPFLRDNMLDRQADVLLALRRSNAELFPARLLKFLETRNRLDFFGILQRMICGMEIPDYQETVLPQIEANFSKKMPAPMAGLREELRSRAIKQLLSTLPDQNKQLQMALTELFPDPQVLHSVIQRSHGVTDATEVLAKWKKSMTVG